MLCHANAEGRKICNNRKNVKAAAEANMRGERVGKRSKAGSEEMRGEGQSDGRQGSGVRWVGILVVATPAVVVGAARENAREREHDC